VPIYDSLGENAVEYIANHAGIELVFTDVSKIHEYTKVSTFEHMHGSERRQAVCWDALEKRLLFAAAMRAWRTVLTAVTSSHACRQCAIAWQFAMHEP